MFRRVAMILPAIALGVCSLALAQAGGGTIQGAVKDTQGLAMPGVTVTCRDWSLEREAADFSSLDIGLYPLPDNPWTRGKCGMKALQYLASGVAAIVSPVGVNRDIVKDGETGRYATDPDEWTERIVAYLRTPTLREAHADAGRAVVRAHWSLAALTPMFVRAMKDLLS